MYLQKETFIIQSFYFKKWSGCSNPIILDTKKPYNIKNKEIEMEQITNRKLGIITTMEQKPD